MRRFLILVWLLVGLGFTGDATGQVIQLDERRIVVEEQRLALDRERFEFEKSKYDRSLEDWIGWASIFATILVALFAYIFQVWNRRRDESLQFQLKAAEIAMDARDATQAKRKAEFLCRLFRKRLQSLEETVNEDKVFPYFGHNLEYREQILKLLIENPESRREIIRAWGILFPWHSSDRRDESDKWFDQLKKIRI